MSALMSRLPGGRLYKLVFCKGKLLRGGVCSVRYVFADDMQVTPFVCGVVCGKKYGPAVQRNLVKRRMRAACLLFARRWVVRLQEPLHTVSVVCVCNKQAQLASWSAVRDELSVAWRAIEKSEEAYHHWATRRRLRGASPNPSPSN